MVSVIGVLLGQWRIKWKRKWKMKWKRGGRIHDEHEAEQQHITLGSRIGNCDDEGNSSSKCIVGQVSAS